MKKYSLDRPLTFKSLKKIKKPKYYTRSIKKLKRLL